MHSATSATPRGRGRNREASRGFIMVMLLVFITTMGLMLTMALPGVKAEIQREQEAELVFRGESIANAIKTYKARTGGFPLKLEDLAKVRPRIIRKLYLDPMTGKDGKEGEWELITAVQPGPSGDKTGLPIAGVHSSCSKDSFRTYLGKTLISDWAFSGADNLLGVTGSAGQGGGIGGGLGSNPIDNPTGKAPTRATTPAPQ